MSRLIDHIWLWGQTPGSHHNHAGYNLPGVNRMTPREGCDYFGIRNICLVACKAGPVPPFDQESALVSDLDNVVWSILGAGGLARNVDNFGDMDEVIRQAKMFPNVMAGVMDDFLFSEERREKFNPARLREMRKHLQQDAGRPLELWTVYYDRELHLDVREYLELFDVITYWTWFGENIRTLRPTFDRIMAENPGKRFIAGCYMWDYGNGRPLTNELMEMQLEIYREYMHAGKLEGIILCSNCIADVGIPEVELTRKWLQLHGDEELPI